MSTVHAPASPFNIVDYANDLLSQPAECIARPAGHIPAEQPADADEFMAWAEADRANTHADDCLRNDFDAVRKHIKEICPGVVHIAISQTRKLTEFVCGETRFRTEYLVFVTPSNGHAGIAAFGKTLEAALADVASKLI